MNLLITGATGFLGSYITKKLFEQGHNITIMKRSFSDIYRIESIINKLDIIDVDKEPLNKVFEIRNIHAVIHTATNYGKQCTSSEVMDSNLIFPLRLLEFLVRYDGVAFINTDSYFNNSNTLNYSYLSNYALSKKYFLELATQYVIKTNIKFINMKLEHLYGPYDNESKFTTSIIKKLLANESVDLTPGEQKRDFIFIEDAVAAFAKVINKLNELNQPITLHQLGQGKANSIAEFVNLAKKLTNSSSQLNFGAQKYRDNEIMYSVANNESLKRLGWNDQIDIERGIQLVVNQIKGKGK